LRFRRGGRRLRWILLGQGSASGENSRCSGGQSKTRESSHDFYCPTRASFTQIENVASLASPHRPSYDFLSSFPQIGFP
jgi:hypothetical protein